MSKIKIFLTLLSVLIIVTPITTQIFLHRDNISGLIIPPAIDDLLNAGVDDINNADAVDIVGISFQLPVLSEAHIFSQNNTAKLIYTFTNPLNNEITITAMNADVVCVEHDFVLGTVSIEPITLGPKQTLDISVNCVLNPQTLEHIETKHQGQNSLSAEFKNFTVDLIGVKIQTDTRKLGPIQIPLLPLAPNQLFR
jgi:hypothetical protein